MGKQGGIPSQVRCRKSRITMITYSFADTEGYVLYAFQVMGIHAEATVPFRGFLCFGGL